MSEILEKARELGTMIAESEEIQAYSAAEAVFLADEEAQKLLADYEQHRTDVANQMRDAEMTPEKLRAFQEEIRSGMDDLMKNVVVKNYLETKSAFSQLVNQVNSVIAYCIKGEEESGCSGSCSTCGGCH